MIKRLLNRFAMLLMLLQISLASQAQQTYNGIVRGANGEGLAGATIVSKSKKMPIVSGANGEFSIQAAPGDVLIISHVGYVTKEVTTGASGLLEVTLSAASEDLEQVVVVGYGTQRKKDLTGAIAVVNPDELKKRQATTVAEALQGLASGVYVRASGGPARKRIFKYAALKI
ncbi:MAG: carboxypeptidase-like regulatory domain-containing protein [Agriterribacter sp.]